MASRVSMPLQILWKQQLSRMQALRVSRKQHPALSTPVKHIETHPPWISTRQQSCPRRGAHWARRIIIRKPHTILGQLIHMRRVIFLGPVTSEVSVSKIIHIDQDYVGLTFSSIRITQKRNQRQQGKNGISHKRIIRFLYEAASLVSKRTAKSVLTKGINDHLVVEPLPSGSKKRSVLDS